VEPWLQAGKYVGAVSSGLPRRNGWTIAEQAGDRTPDRTQRLLNRAAWDTFAAMGVVRRFAVSGLDEAARRPGRRAGLRIGALDETGQEKKGTATAGVKRQHMGCAGGVENGINTVHLSYVREKTGHALIGARQWIPAEHIDNPVTSLVTGLPPDPAGIRRRLSHGRAKFLRGPTVVPVLGRRLSAPPVPRPASTDDRRNLRLPGRCDAVDALMHGGELPGPRRDARLLQLSEPYVTKLAQLGELIQIAKDRGCAGTALPQGRALVASSLSACLRRWGADHTEQGRVLAATRQQAIEQADIATAMHHIRGLSGDTASRSPIMAPWSIWPVIGDVREGHPSEGRQACWHWRSDADGNATWGPTSRPVPQWTRPGATAVETLGRHGHHH